MARTKLATHLSDVEIERFLAAAEALHKSIVGPLLAPGCEHYRALQNAHEALLKSIERFTGKKAPFIRWILVWLSKARKFDKKHDFRLTWRRERDSNSNSLVQPPRQARRQSNRYHTRMPRFLQGENHPASPRLVSSNTPIIPKFTYRAAIEHLMFIGRRLNGVSIRTHRRHPSRLAAALAGVAQCRVGRIVGDASRQALIAIVDLCLAERVDALVIAGDLYDGDQTSMKTARFLGSQMSRLHQAGIRVFKIRGNHDALSRISKQLVFPDTVTIFGGRAQSVSQTAGGLDVMFHGLSFANPKAPESLLPKYAAAHEGAVNIGIMHTSLAGSPGHDVYAPCNVADLHAHGFDYWALGHIHVRNVHPGASTVVMPGMPQGRDINEAGEKSVTLVTIRDDRSIEIEERLTSIAQFERVERRFDRDASNGRKPSAASDPRCKTSAPPFDPAMPLSASA